MEIPEGYVLIPKIWAEKYFIRAEWDNIENPTISEVSNYLGISTDKIRKDLGKADCPLRKSSFGGRGRGKEITFFKSTVKHYKDWIRENRISN